MRAPASAASTTPSSPSTSTSRRGPGHRRTPSSSTSSTAGWRAVWTSLRRPAAPAAWMWSGRRRCPTAAIRSRRCWSRSWTRSGGRRPGCSAWVTCTARLSPGMRPCMRGRTGPSAAAAPSP
eukprot:SM005157S17660  [mRNA]  locus=s5157:139:908:- [translate_table: standard]